MHVYSHFTEFSPAHVESRILIGSVSRVTLKELLDEHMKGVYEHAQQIREQVRDQVIFHKNQDSDDEDNLEIVSAWVVIVVCSLLPRFSPSWALLIVFSLPPSLPPSPLDPSPLPPSLPPLKGLLEERPPTHKLQLILVSGYGLCSISP